MSGRLGRPEACVPWKPHSFCTWLGLRLAPWMLAMAQLRPSCVFCLRAGKQLCPDAFARPCLPITPHLPLPRLLFPHLPANCATPAHLAPAHLASPTLHLPTLHPPTLHPPTGYATSACPTAVRCLCRSCPPHACSSHICLPAAPHLPTPHPSTSCVTSACMLQPICSPCSGPGGRRRSAAAWQPRHGERGRPSSAADW